MKKFKYIGIVAIAFLSGCGGGASDVTQVTSLSQIEGLWDASTQEDGLRDEAYIDIGQDGKLTIYDYLGDEYDDEADCYIIANLGTLTNNGNGNFQLDSSVDNTSVNVTGKLQNNNLLFTAYGQTDIMSPATLTVEEMKMKDCANL